MRRGTLERDSIRRSGGGTVTAAITNISAGTTLGAGPSIVFSDSNNVSFGMNGNTVTATASFAAGAGLTISGGTGTASSGSFLLSGSDFSFNLSTGAPNTLQVSYLGKQISYTENYRMADMLNGDFLIGSVFLQHYVLPAVRIDATQMDLMVNISNSANAGATISYRVGIYTLSGSTASLASSGSRVISYNSTLGGSSSYTNVSNWRMHSIALGTWSMTPGDYLLAFWVSTSSALTNGSYSFRNGRNLTNLAEPHSTGNYSKYWNAMGAFASTTTNLPGSIHLSQHIVTFASNVEVPLYPWVQIAGTF